MKTPRRILKTFFTNCILKNNSVKAAFYTIVKNLRGGCLKNGRHKGSFWTLIIFSSKVINFEHFAQTSTITQLFVKVQIWLARSLGFKVQSLQLATLTSFCVCDFIDLVLSSSFFTLFVCHSFLILFYLRNSRSDFFVTDYFPASHSVSITLPRKTLWLSVILSFMITKEA